MLPLLFLLASTSPSPEPELDAAPRQLAQEDDRLEDDLEDLPPPPPFEEAEESAEEAPGESVAPPPPAADPSDLGEPTPPPAAETTPVPTGATQPVNRLLAFGVGASIGAATGLPAAGCCFCCGWAGCLAPPLFGAVGAGGGTLAGALVAGVPLSEAWLPTLVALAMGLAGGIAALPCGCATYNVMLQLFGRGSDLPRPFPLTDSQLLVASAVSGATVLSVLAGGALGGAGVAWLLLPEEVPADPDEPVSHPGEGTPPAPRAAQAVAY